MFQNRRTVFLFVCSIVFVQALYYIATLQIKKNETPIVKSTSIAIGTTYSNQSSDRSELSVHKIFNTSNLTQTTSIPELNSTRNSANLTFISSSSTVTVSTLTTTASTVPLSITSTSSPSSSSSATTTTTTPTNTTIKANDTAIQIPFLNATFYSSFNYSSLTPDIYTNLTFCNFSTKINDSSVYKVNISQTLFSYDIIEENYGKELYPGGHYIPNECRTEQRLALIICYRNREQHLKLFLANIHPFLQKQKLDYTIFVVNQNGKDQFNRAALFNVGYIEAMKLYPYDCFIFHDVDLLPEDLRNVYKCGNQPRHMSVAVDKFNYKLLYSTLFGGVTAFNRSDFLGANGYPTVYWGWGGEDDDMYLRVVQKLKKSITRYPMEIARYKMIRTHDHTSGKANPHRHTILYSKYDYNRDGINTANYTLHNIVFYKLFTLINVSLTEEPFEQIRTRLNIKKKP